MSKFLSTFLAGTASLATAFCLLAVGSGSVSATPSGEPPAAPPTTTTAPSPDGNPWHD
ncbi:hypothetical protein [Amycolatopsis magusensis]|uniref:hypothetical protein n=1 Tax=Amycolatopsis magusensis TaxID=882444 RepID=UPI003C2F9973